MYVILVKELAIVSKNPLIILYAMIFGMTNTNFVKCGIDPGTGSDKTKRHTCMRLNNIPIESVADTAWLYFLFRIRAFGHKDHDHKIFYSCSSRFLVIL